MKERYKTGTTVAFEGFEGAERGAALNVICAESMWFNVFPAVSFRYTQAGPAIRTTTQVSPRVT
jgi:hypothetical protein